MLIELSKLLVYFHFCRGKLHYAYVEETHMMLVAFFAFRLLQHLGTKDNERNLCQDLLTIENTDSNLKMHELHYVNELIVRVRLSFQKLQVCRLTKQAETTRNHQNRFWL